MIMKSSEDILLWSNNTWCYRHELEEMTHLSDDYIEIPVGSLHYPDEIVEIEPEYDKIIRGRKAVLAAVGYTLDKD